MGIDTQVIGGVQDRMLQRRWTVYSQNQWGSFGNRGATKLRYLPGVADKLGAHSEDEWLVELTIWYDKNDNVSKATLYDPHDALQQDNRALKLLIKEYPEVKGRVYLDGEQVA